MLHAVWNALAKRARDQLVFLWSSGSLASVVLVPVGLLGLPEGGVPAAAVPYVVATIVIHAGYFVTLGRACRHGDFARVYRIARGLGVALVPVAALVVFGERLSPLGTVGVALVVAGVAGLHLAVGSRGGGRPRPRGAGTAWALLTGLLIATYSIVDKAGVTRIHPLPYIALMGLGMSALLTPAVVRDRLALAREWRENWRTIAVASSMNLTSYLLVLFAFRLSKVGYVVAGRELSILFSTLIGSLWLGEGRLLPRLAGAPLVLAGVPCVGLARTAPDQVGGGELGDEPSERPRERRSAERAVHLVGPGAPVATRHLPESPIGERRGELPRAHASEPVALAGEREDGVRARLDVAVDGPREVDAEERELGVGDRIDEAAHERASLGPEQVVLARERDDPA